MNTLQGALMTAGSTDATQIVVTDADYNEIRNWHITVISGTVKFGIGAVAAAAGHGWAAGATVCPFRCKNGELYFDAASALDTFVVSSF